MLTYILIKTFNLYNFLDQIAQRSYYINTLSSVSNYINFYLFGAIVLLLLLTLLIYYILSLKNKERKLYLIVCIYYVLMFVYFIYMLGIIQKLQVTVLDIETARALRDICLIVLLPQVVLAFIILGRTLGFNIKQFDFKKDLEEMKIDVSDYEEVEVTFGKDNYKITRFLRKVLRFTKYLILEHKFVVTILSSIIVLISSLIIFISMRVYNINYKENQEILANTLWYTAEQSYITNSDMNNNIIAEGKYYLLVRVNINNKSTREYILSRDAFKLEYKKDYLAPMFTMQEYFLDIGQTYAPMEIEPGENKELIVVFELEEDNIAKEYLFKIKNFDSSSFGTIEAEYKDIILSPYNLISDNDRGESELPTEIDFNNTVLGNTKLSIKSYDIASSFKEKYEICSSTNCYEGTYIVKPQLVGKGSMNVLKIESSVVVDDSLYLKKFMKTSGDLFGYYAKLRYRAYGKTKTISIDVIDAKYSVEKYAYLEVPAELQYANKIELILNVRGIKNTIILK